MLFIPPERFLLSFWARTHWPIAHVQHGKLRAPSVADWAVANRFPGQSKQHRCGREVTKVIPRTRSGKALGWQPPRANRFLILPCFYRCFVPYLRPIWRVAVDPGT
jgi:hypothetical protein